MRNILYTLMFLFALNANSQNKTPSIKSLSLSYMKAYGDWDYKKMGTFYSDSIHFQDPTAIEAFASSNFDLVGKEKVVGLFKSIFPDKLPEHVAFRVKDLFVSGSYAVISSYYELLLPKSWYKEKADGKIFINIPIVTILRFNKGKIISHSDYADYNAYKKQISLQLKKSKQ